MFDAEPLSHPIEPSLLNRCPVVPVVVLDDVSAGSTSRRCPARRWHHRRGDHPADGRRSQLHHRAGGPRGLAGRCGVRADGRAGRSGRRRRRTVRGQPRPVDRGRTAMPRTRRGHAPRYRHALRTHARRRTRAHRSEVLPSRAARGTGRNQGTGRSLCRRALPAVRRRHPGQSGRLPVAADGPGRQRQLDGRPSPSPSRRLRRDHRSIIGGDRQGLYSPPTALSPPDPADVAGHTANDSATLIIAAGLTLDSTGGKRTTDTVGAGSRQSTRPRRRWVVGPSTMTTSPWARIYVSIDPTTAPLRLTVDRRHPPRLQGEETYGNRTHHRLGLSRTRFPSPPTSLRSSYPASSPWLRSGRSETQPSSRRNDSSFVTLKA